MRGWLGIFCSFNTTAQASCLWRAGSTPSRVWRFMRLLGQMRVFRLPKFGDRGILRA
jgi:hypothetical protein